MLKVKNVTPLDGYRLHVVFENSLEKICNLAQFLEIGSFRELKEIQLFNQVKNAGYSVEWPNELDLSTDTLLSI
jgi:hypothetical protein